MAGPRPVSLTIREFVDSTTGRPVVARTSGEGALRFYTLVDRTSTDLFKNKILTDPSNKISAGYLTIGGTAQQIGGSLSEGATLQYLNGALVFAPPGGSSNDNNNAIFGAGSGASLTTGGGNAIFGDGAAPSATTGSLNTLIGVASGFTITDGSSNTLVGADSDVASGSLTGCLALGRGAIPQLAGEFALGSAGTPINTLATAVAGAGAAPPATVEGYIYVRLNGTLRAIPYYNPTP